MAEKKIFKKILKNNLIIFVIYIINCTIIIGLIDNVDANNNSNGQIIIDLSPDTPAKNQEVLLSIQVIDLRGFPTSNLPLNITITCLSYQLDAESIQFLYDLNPKTDNNGEYSIIFNAPCFDPFRDAHYRINVEVKLNDGFDIFAAHEFYVKEKVFDTIKDDTPKLAAPGSWYSIIYYDFDFKQISISVFQNEIFTTKTWEIEDWKRVGGMYEGKKGSEDNNKGIYEIYSIEDEFSILYRFEGDSQMLMRIGYYPAKTIIYKFLVTEVFGNEIIVNFSGYINGQKSIETYYIPTIPLNRPIIGITDRYGVWFFLSKDNGDKILGTSQNKDIYIYIIGFKNNFNLKIHNMSNTIVEKDLLSVNYIFLYKWHIPKNTSVGFYSLFLEGYDFNNNLAEQTFNFYIKREPKKKESNQSESLQLSNIVINILLIFILIIIIIFILYRYIKRKKLINYFIKN